jgi:hypothetical protein
MKSVTIESGLLQAFYQHGLKINHGMDGTKSAVCSQITELHGVFAAACLTYRNIKQF